MRNILITGENSYVGKSLGNYLCKSPDKYTTHFISLRNDEWKNVDFSRYDVLFHAAAVVHKKEKPEMESMFIKVNSELAIEVAKKAKDEGIKQFIFISTMSVYGTDGEIGSDVVIEPSTVPSPKTYYGKSKLLAEIELNKLNDDKFKVLVLRPPMIYGPNCTGNYARLEKFALKSPLFPMIDNKRSMLSIYKLCKDVKGYIDQEKYGLFLPQDDYYVNTSLLVKKIAEENGRRLYLSKTLGFIVKLVGKRVNILKKIFGNLVYKM
ncbi:NAD-dependent epimerase/dehydratase family protein [Clostridium sp.]|uniref:NAD-dependent epimerase/dehydratase family protein n=1 Tax=Clostridium sp. TaxID=1506 RepID=UPI003D6D9630